MNSVSSSEGSMILKPSSMLSTNSSIGDAHTTKGNEKCKGLNIPFSERRVDRFGYPQPHRHMVQGASSKVKGNVKSSQDDTEVSLECIDRGSCIVLKLIRLTDSP